MLSTINGFDLLLITTIVVMGFKIYNLNRECESYVGQILKIGWHTTSTKVQPPKRNEADHCNFCLGVPPQELYSECTCPPF
jgi:hypothetical protein